MKNIKKLRWYMLLKLEWVIPVKYLRPVIANLLMKEVVDYDSYYAAFCLLIDQKFIGKSSKYLLPPRLWNTNSIVNVSRLGMNLILDLRDSIQRSIYFTGQYEPETFDFIKKNLKKGYTFIDIGAHIGIYTLFTAKLLKELGGGTNIAFEPIRDSAKSIIRNAKRNDLDVTVVRTALGRKSEKYVPIYGDYEWGNHEASVRSLFGNGPVVSYIDIISFDEWAQNKELSKIDMIKLDVEGGEYNVIQGMIKSIKKYKPKWIIIEIKDSELTPAGRTSKEIFELMSTLGYESDGYPLGFNFVFKPQKL